MIFFTSLISLFACALAATTEPLKCSMPIDKHEDVLLTLKGCSSGSDDLVFELLDLPINGTVEFRAGVVSASLPVKLNMELLTKNAFNRGTAEKIMESIKRITGEAGITADGVQVFDDVEKIKFKVTEPVMYVRVSADYNGELRPDMTHDQCEPLRLSIVVEKLIFGRIPFTTAILIGTSTVVLLFFWLVGMPLIDWALGPQLDDKTKKVEQEKGKESKKNK